MSGWFLPATLAACGAEVVDASAALNLPEGRQEGHEALSFIRIPFIAALLNELTPHQLQHLDDNLSRLPEANIAFTGSIFSMTVW